MEKKYSKGITKRSEIKEFVDWYLKEFGNADSHDMHQYAVNAGLFNNDRYNPGYLSFKSQMVQQCKGKTCQYDPKTRLWSLMKKSLTSKEAFEMKYLATS